MSGGFIKHISNLEPDDSNKLTAESLSRAIKSCEEGYFRPAIHFVDEHYLHILTCAGEKLGMTPVQVYACLDVWWITDGKKFQNVADCVMEMNNGQV